MEYRGEIDGLRAFAVLVVIFFHAGLPGFSGGFVGVDVFFVLSGYLISSILLTEYAKTDRISYVDFVIRRIRRILPALLFVILVCIVLAWFLMTPRQLRDFAQSGVATLFFGSNILFWIESGYFAPIAETKPLLHTWSLAIEEQFYIFFPALMALILKFKPSLLKPTVIVLTLIGILLSALYSESNPEAAFFLTPMRAWGILVGVLVAIDLHKRAKPVEANMVSQGLALLGFAGLVFSVVFFDEFTVYPGLAATIPIFGTAIVLRFATADSYLGRVFTLKPLVWIGLLSYSLYLWHQPALVFSRMYFLEHLQGGQVMFALAITFILALISWKYIEKPFRNQQKIGVKPLLASVLVASVMSLTFFGVAIKQFGDLGRYDTASLERLEVLKKANTSRQYAILADDCHYNNRTGIGVKGFIEQWDCMGELKDSQPSVMIAGDSHSADLAVSLRENNIEVTQLGGAGCSLDPGLMTDVCKELFTVLLPKVAEKRQHDIVVLANRYEGNEQNIESAKRSYDYWKHYANKVVILTSAIELPAFDRSVAINQVLSGKNYRSPHSGAGIFFDYFKSKGAEVIDRKAIFCSLVENCEYLDNDDNMLMVDPDHLSIYGAGVFGKKFKEVLFN